MNQHHAGILAPQPRHLPFSKGHDSNGMTSSPLTALSQLSQRDRSRTELSVAHLDPATAENEPQQAPIMIIQAVVIEAGIACRSTSALDTRGTREQERLWCVQPAFALSRL